jgi:hypothetical protein
MLDEIINAIGERRPRDLLDLVAGVERDEGWNSALQHLITSASGSYSTPASFGKQQTKIESLKFREMIFGLLSCNGLEPVEPDTLTLLHMLKSEASIADASQLLLFHTQELAMKQIKSGDTLFFNPPSTQKFDDLNELLNEVRTEQIANLTLTMDDKLVDLTPMWYSEFGRLALSNIGIQGKNASKEQFDMVLSVIQVSQDVKKRIKIAEKNKTSKARIVKPSNQMYGELQEHIIAQDIEGLIVKGSSHSLPILNAILDNAVIQYVNSKSSEDYRLLLQCINSHVVVRQLDSITHLEKLLNVKDQRIITPAITALGNLYHESSAQAIIDLFCKTANEQLIKSSVTALENIVKKSPETLVVIRNTQESDCKNRRHLRQFLKSEYQQ